MTWDYLVSRTGLFALVLQLLGPTVFIVTSRRASLTSSMSHSDGVLWLESLPCKQTRSPEECWESHSSLWGNNHALLSHDVPLTFFLCAIRSLKKRVSESAALNWSLQSCQCVPFCPIFFPFFCISGFNNAFRLLLGPYFFFHAMYIHVSLYVRFYQAISDNWFLIAIFSS